MVGGGEDMFEEVVRSVVDERSEVGRARVSEETRRSAMMWLSKRAMMRSWVRC